MVNTAGKLTEANLSFIQLHRISDGTRTLMDGSGYNSLVRGRVDLTSKKPSLLSVLEKNNCSPSYTKADHLQALCQSLLLFVASFLHLLTLLTWLLDECSWAYPLYSLPFVCRSSTWSYYAELVVTYQWDKVMLGSSTKLSELDICIPTIFISYIGKFQTRVYLFH